MSYEFYKVVHIFCIVLAASFAGAQFFAKQTPKYVKIVSGVASALILVSGMGLISRIGLSHGASWPLWIKVKMGLWLLLASLGPILGRRLAEDKKRYGFSLIIILFFITILTAISKFS